MKESEAALHADIVKRPFDALQILRVMDTFDLARHWFQVHGISATAADIVAMATLLLDRVK
jgi:hypothetical protein